LRQAVSGGVPILNNMGFKKTMLYVTGLLLAVGGPVSVFSTTDLVAGKNKGAPPATSAAAPPVGQPPSTSAANGPGAVTNQFLAPVPPADSTPTPSLAEVLRFDLTVDSILRQWPRVSTGLPHLQLQGYRVPLVTGAKVSDVAGALTYYFNTQQQVQRITLRGTTGDPGEMVSLLANRHHFARRLTNDPGLLLYETVDSGSRLTGSLRIRSAGIVTTSQPYQRFEVDLVMDRPE
jgi:hypothetical protein